MALGKNQRKALALLVVDRSVSLPSWTPASTLATYKPLVLRGFARCTRVRNFWRYRPTMEGARALVLELAARLEA